MSPSRLLKIFVLIGLSSIILVGCHFSSKQDKDFMISGNKSGINKFIFQFETYREEEQSLTEVVIVPHLLYFERFETKGEPTIKEITIRRRFIGEKQHGIRRTEKTISEGTPTIRYDGTLPDSIFAAYFRNRIVEEYGLNSSFSIDNSNLYHVLISYADDRNFVDYYGSTSFFNYTPSFETFVSFGKIIGATDFQELEDVYHNFILNKKPYNSNTLEIDNYNSNDSGFRLWLPQKKNWDMTGSNEATATWRIQEEIWKTNAYINSKYTQAEIDGWRDEYGVAFEFEY